MQTSYHFGVIDGIEQICEQDQIPNKIDKVQVHHVTSPICRNPNNRQMCVQRAERQCATDEARDSDFCKCLNSPLIGQTIGGAPMKPDCLDRECARLRDHTAYSRHPNEQCRMSIVDCRQQVNLRNVDSAVMDRVNLQANCTAAPPVPPANTSSPNEPLGAPAAPPAAPPATPPAPPATPPPPPPEPSSNTTLMVAAGVGIFITLAMIVSAIIINKKKAKN